MNSVRSNNIKMKYQRLNSFSKLVLE